MSSRSGKIAALRELAEGVKGQHLRKLLQDEGRNKRLFFPSLKTAEGKSLGLLADFTRQKVGPIFWVL